MLTRLLIAVFVLALATIVPSSAQQSTGRYEGTLVFRPLANGRQFELVEPFGYVDGNRRFWAVPPGAKVDGASIPQALWSILGAPFTGKYREAAVVHDHYCDVKVYSSAETHRAFYEAMLTSGEDKVRAKLMYYAVLRFGPSWRTTPPIFVGPPGGPIEMERRVRGEVPFDEADLATMQTRLGGGDVELSELEDAAAKARQGLDKAVCHEKVPTESASSVMCRTKRE